ncbi:MAG TPA: CHAT domain-containing tetratricopeptide repeat protein, partial [Pyrinomonadaceae bacterium]|nr:CHAT domain-containing tetratricopeptide repeat protein [Pyrinomonadaceae bacterium]
MSKRLNITRKATPTLLICAVLSGCFASLLQASPATPDPSQHAYELLAVSENQINVDPELAVRTAQEALALFQSVNDVVGIATSYEQLGRCYFTQTEMAESARYYDLALASWRQQSNVQKQADALIMLSYIDVRTGEWMNAVSYLTQAQSLFDEQDLEHMAQIASGLGALFNESGLSDSALVQFQRAMTYFQQTQNRKGYDRMLLLIGYTHFLLGNYSAALTNLQQALTNFEGWPKPEKLFIAECHEYFGHVYFARGQYHIALQHLEPTLTIYKKALKLQEAARVEALMGRIYEQQRFVSSARESYLEASRMFREQSNQMEDSSVRFALGRLELNTGNYETAEGYLRDSIEQTENVRGDLPTRLFAAGFSAQVHERYEAYIECLMRKHKSQRSEQAKVLAFEASELGRARSLSELLRDTQTTALAGVAPELAQQEKSLRQAIRIAGDQTVALLATDYKRVDLDKLQSELLSLREKHKRITARMRKLNPDYAKIEEPPRYSLQQIQSLVVQDDQTVLLEYFLAPKASYVWAITRNDVKVFELPAAEVITAAVKRVYNNVSQEPHADSNGDLSKATAELTEIVLRPVADQLAAARIIVVADGALNYIPFQLLSNPLANNEPLISKYEVINAPSASTLGQLRQEKQQRLDGRKVLAAFGDPVFPANYAQFKDSSAGSVLAAANPVTRDIKVKADKFDLNNIQPLLYTKHELQNLSEIAGPKSFVARGFTASRETLDGLDLSQYSILHFATHGNFDPAKPELSGFVLSTVDPDGHKQDGFITMQDVYRLHAPVDLVVLSACGTGLGKEVKGEGLIGVTSGFMYAGASSVVASLWNVDDEATAELMKHFYANMLQKRMRPAEALRAAQNTVRENPQWSSPHFWAGFILQGEFKEPIRLPAPTGAPRVVQNAVGASLLLMLLLGIA